MADKIIHIRINVEKIEKKWLYKGEKGTYLDATIFYNEEQDDKGGNGMITQTVPTDIYKKEVADKVPKDKRTRGEILGNCKEWQKGGDSESIPGSDGKKTSTKKNEKVEEEVEDDLPF